MSAIKSIKDKCIITCILLILLAFMISPISYGADKYITITTEDKCKIEIPASWILQEGGRNEKIQDLTDKTLESADIKQNPGQNKILLSAALYDNSHNSLASARVSVRNAKALSQAEVKQVSNTDIQQMGLEQKKQLEDGLTKLNIKTKYIGSNKQIINGKVSIVIETEMTLPDGKKIRQIGDTFFLGDKVVKMSVAYDPVNGKVYRPIVDRIRNSLTIPLSASSAALSRVSSSYQSSEMKPVIVATTIQSADGATEADLNQAMLKLIENWSVETILQKSRNKFAEMGYNPKDFKPKVTASSVYVTAEGKKLAIIKVNIDIVRSVTIMGIKGDELHRVSCMRSSNHDIPVWSGECGNKVREVFGVSIQP